MRGEHCCRINWRAMELGSSPHARGAPAVVGVDERDVGIIPACAGSTELHAGRRHRAGDHPRMRGEHAPDNASATCSRGSSPHARGAPLRPFRPPGGVGIIPACAGSTRRSNSLSYSSGDHPRMRGEHPTPSTSQNAHTGSSPHARGALHRLVGGVDVVGIIPACAGSTLEYLQLCPGLKRITLTLPITSEADKRTEKHPNHQLMPRAFRPSRRHCRAGCGPIHCLTPRTSWPSCTCLPCSSPFSSCRQASRHPCPSAS